MASLLSRIARNEPAPVDVPSSLLRNLEQTGVSWFWASDADGRLEYISDAAIDALNCAREEIIGSALTDLFKEDDTNDGETSGRPLKLLLKGRSSIMQKIVFVEADERRFWWEISGKAVFEARQFIGFRGVAKDVSGVLEARLAAERLSQFDSLTGLANRYRMARQLDAALIASHSTNRSCALAMMDLDRFKQVNDTLGHPAGDELLKQVADRIERVVGENCEIGRLGGDEFQIILQEVGEHEELEVLGKRLIQMVSQPYQIGGARTVIGASVGIAIAPDDGDSSEELVKAADLALYAAKADGRGRCCFYSEEMRASAALRHQLEVDLREAIVKDELQVQYQPIVDAGSHSVTSLEALMRWKHTERGMISPGDFIPVAEEVGIIRDLGEWALNEVCREVKQWPSTVKAAVNVSAVQFASDDFPDVVSRALRSSGVNPAQIELEITESVFVGDIERTWQLFKALKKLGVSLALDDFGTGYSSFGYLRDAPFDKIKIDQSFVRGSSVSNSNNSAIISSVVSLARSLGMNTVAEGVETKDDMRQVTELGVTHLQGFLFSRPLESETIKARFEIGDLRFNPSGPERFRAPRRTEFRQINLVHGDHKYSVFLRNISKTGAKIEGLLGVPKGTEVVLDLGDGQLAVAVVRRTEGNSQGVEFETPLVSDGKDGLRTPGRVPLREIEAAYNPLSEMVVGPGTVVVANQPTLSKAFLETETNRVAGSHS